MDDLGASEGLSYLSAVATVVFVLRRHRAELERADRLTVGAACVRLITAEPGSVRAWGDLARIARILHHALHDQAHPFAVLLEELHRDLLQRRDRAAERTRIEP